MLAPSLDGKGPAKTSAQSAQAKALSQRDGPSLITEEEAPEVKRLSRSGGRDGIRGQGQGQGRGQGQGQEQGQGRSRGGDRGRGRAGAGAGAGAGTGAGAGAGAGAERGGDVCGAAKSKW